MTADWIKEQRDFLNAFTAWLNEPTFVTLANIRSLFGTRANIYAAPTNDRHLFVVWLEEPRRMPTALLQCASFVACYDHEDKCYRVTKNRLGFPVHNDVVKQWAADLDAGRKPKMPVMFVDGGASYSRLDLDHQADHPDEMTPEQAANLLSQEAAGLTSLSNPYIKAAIERAREIIKNRE